MSEVKYNIFLISKGFKNRVAITTFIADDYTEAKIYFKGFCESHYDSQKIIDKNYNKEYFVLHKIGDLNKDFEVKGCNIYITDSLTTSYMDIKTTTLQEKLFKEKQRCDKIINLTMPKTEKIKQIFEGNYINEKN